MDIPLSSYVPENLVSLDEISRLVPRQPAHSPNSARIWCLLTRIPISAAAFNYLFKPPYAIGSVPSLSGHAIAYQWRSLPRVRRDKVVSSHQGSSSNGCCHFAGLHGAINLRLSFPTPTIGMKWAC